MGALPLYAPADRAIPAPGIRAPAHFEGRMVSDRTVLQRERRRDVPGWLFSTASTLVAVMVLALLAAFGFALVRIARYGDLPLERLDALEHEDDDLAVRGPLLVLGPARIDA
jgi:hypothetical protein